MITQKLINDLSYKIIGACIEVHKLTGLVYMKGLSSMLRKEFDLLGLQYQSELEIPFFV
jgi:hypothetical protein